MRKIANPTSTVAATLGGLNRGWRFGSGQPTLLARRTVWGMSVALLAFLPTLASGQTFLEKLESAVRKKLDNPPSATEPQPTPTQEELPAPNREPAPTSPNRDIPVVPKPSGRAAASSEAIPSILESPTKDNKPLELTPGAPAEPTAGEPAAGPGVYLGLEVEELVGGGIGVRVAELTKNSPAWKAGFKVGDRILAIDGHAIANIDGMADRMRRVVPGAPTKFLINRTGRNTELTAVLQDAALAARIFGSPGQAQVVGPAWIGVTVYDVSPAFREQFGLSIFSGAAVTNVAPGSPAQLAGIRPGDAIVEVDGVPIAKGDDLMVWLKSAKVGQSAELMVYRGIQRSYVSLVVSTDPRVDTGVERRSAGTTPRPSQSGLQNRSNASLQAEISELRERLELTQRQLEMTQQQLNEAVQRLNSK